MEINEAVSTLTKTLTEDAYCGKEENRNPGWKVVIHGVKGGVGDAAVLKDNMIAAEESKPDEPAILAGGWDLFSCGQNRFPVQTHHLICEKYLPKHRVTVWLTDDPPEPHSEYILEADTSYDTNGAANGYFMPFASTTAQWKKTRSATKRNNICFEMMRLTQIQLHQGPHSTRDYLEEEDAETEGYKTMLDSLLNMIYARTELHVKTCDVCKGKKKRGKIPVQPLEATVRHMELVSELLKALIGFWRIAVSARAASYYRNNNKAGRIKHRSNAFITAQDI